MDVLYRSYQFLKINYYCCYGNQENRNLDDHDNGDHDDHGDRNLDDIEHNDHGYGNGDNGNGDQDHGAGNHNNLHVDGGHANNHGNEATQVSTPAFNIRIFVYLTSVFHRWREVPPSLNWRRQHTTADTTAREEAWQETPQNGQHDCCKLAEQLRRNHPPKHAENDVIPFSG